MVTQPISPKPDSDAEPLWPAAPPRADIEPFRNIALNPSQGSAAVLPNDLAIKGKILADALLEDGAVEEAFLAFAQDAFNRPDSLAMVDKYLVNLFAGDLGLLARLMRISDLAFALRHRCGEVCRVVVTRWSEAGELHQLTKLADAMLPQPHHYANSVAAEIMLILAASLALQKQRRATELLAHTKHHLRHPQHTALHREAESWVDAGNVILKLPAIDRAMWTARLRAPHKTWSWDTAEEVAALGELTQVLSPSAPSAPLFYAILPRQHSTTEHVESRVIKEPQVQRENVKPSTTPSPDLSSMIFFGLGAVFASSVACLIEYFDSGTIHQFLHYLVTLVHSG